MVDIRVVRVIVREHLMHVGMRVGFARRVVRTVDVLMVFVVDVPVSVRYRGVRVLMNVALGQVQPDAKRHEEAAGNKERGERLPPKGQGQKRADERGGGKVGPGPGGPEAAERQHEEYEAYAVAKEAQGERSDSTGQGRK